LDFLEQNKAKDTNRMQKKMAVTRFMASPLTYTFNFIFGCPPAPVSSFS